MSVAGAPVGGIPRLAPGRCPTRDTAEGDRAALVAAATPERHTTERDVAERGGGGTRASTVAPALPLDFERVYEAELDFVWRSLRLLGVDPNAVEDATQDVFSIVSRRLAGFEGRSSLRTWLFAILQRVAANQRRTARRKQWPLTALDEGVIAPGPTPHAQVEAAQSIDIVQRFCDTLDPERRAVFVLALLEELPASEVSEALGIPINTVYSRVRSLRDGLRRMLEEKEKRRG